MNDENYYFHYRFPNEGDKASRFGNRIGIDGLEWIYEHKRYELQFKDKDGGRNLVIHNNKIFICYNGISPSFPAPNNLVIYTPTGEIERILTTPILPNGRKGAGFMELGSSRHYLEKDMMDDKYLNVTVWAHEHSQWVDYYHLDTETLEFTFRHTGRY
jgi:hypothetical protein